MQRKSFIKISLWAALLLTLPRIPAEQGKIAFISNRDGNFEIYVMNPDSSNQASSSELSHRILRRDNLEIFLL
jgi:hypothetical protein